jgi:hypothetical protein
MELRRTKAENHHAGLIDALASVSEAALRDVVLAVSKPRHMLHQRAENAAGQRVGSSNRPRNNTSFVRRSRMRNRNG